MGSFGTRTTNAATTDAEGVQENKNKRDLKQRLREVGQLYGDGSTPKRPKSLKTKTPKGGISVSEETKKGQVPQAALR
eukprot:SAG11_NODE_11030_length_788_cov_5.725689_1_plen_78_part_00